MWAALCMYWNRGCTANLWEFFMHLCIVCRLRGGLHHPVLCHHRGSEYHSAGFSSYHRYSRSLYRRARHPRRREIHRQILHKNGSGPWLFLYWLLPVPSVSEPSLYFFRPFPDTWQRFSDKSGRRRFSSEARCRAQRVRHCLFTNEAGIGTAAIAAASSETRDPRRQSLISMTAVFWDTVVMCAVTGLVIVTNIKKNPSSILGFSSASRFRRFYLPSLRRSYPALPGPCGILP